MNMHRPARREEPINPEGNDPMNARPRAAIGHVPFPGHRTQAEIRQAQERSMILRGLGRDPKA